jgi:putative endonuclease
METLKTKDSETTPMTPKNEWSLYMIKTRMNTLYTGISLDVERRLKEHSGDNKRGARYLKGKGPLELMWQECVGSKSDALSLEYRVKKLNRRQKQSLIDGQIDLQSLVKKNGVE